MPFRIWLGVVFVAAVGCIPIVGQPVQVDDPLFLGVAKQILQTPASPFDGHPPWHDGDWFSENANPPLWPYLLAATAAIFGWNETAFHGLQCAANVALTFGVFRLARRVCPRPLFWTTACMLSPFLLPGRNLMADTLLLALWCWSFEFFLQEALDGKGGFGVWAGLLAAAALLTKYSGGLLAPLFFLLGWRWRTCRLWAWLIPAIAFALWCGHNQIFYGRIHFCASVGAGGISLLDRLRVFIRIVGGVMLVWVPAWTIAAWAAGGVWRRVALLVSLPAAALLAGADLFDVINRFQSAQVIAAGLLVAHFAAFIAAGLVLLAGFAVLPLGLGEEGPAGRARVALALWLGAATAFNLLATSNIAFGAVRHLLLALVPLVLLGGGAFDRVAGSTAVRIVRWLSLAAGAGLGGLLAHGDRLAARAGVQTADRVWFLIAEGKHVSTFGDPAMRYYAEPLGAHWWRGAIEEVPVGGMIVALYSRGIVHWRHPMFSEHARRVRREWLESWNPFCTQTEYASFYAGNVTTLPWELAMNERGPHGGWAYDEIYVYERQR